MYDDPQLVHWDSMLTNISVGYDNERDPFVGDQLAPVVTVQKQSDRYYKFTRDTWGRPTNDIRAPAARAYEIPPMKLSRDQYFANEHALVGVVPIEDVENADPGLDSFGTTTDMVANGILLNRENDIISMATDPGNFAPGFKGTPANGLWDDYLTGTSHSTPIYDMKRASNKIHGFLGTMPNTAIVQWEVASAIEDHPQFSERLKYTTGNAFTDDIIARLMGIGRFVRAGSLALTSGFGVSPETIAYQWPRVALLAYVPPAPARRQPAFMYEFNYPFQTGLGNVGNTPAGLMPTERWYDIDNKAWRIRTARRYDLKFITTDENGKSTGGFLLHGLIKTTTS